MDTSEKSKKCVRFDKMAEQIQSLSDTNAQLDHQKLKAIDKARQFREFESEANRNSKMQNDEISSLKMDLNGKRF